MILYFHLQLSFQTRSQSVLVLSPLHLQKIMELLDLLFAFKFKAVESFHDPLLFISRLLEHFLRSQDVVLHQKVLHELTIVYHRVALVEQVLERGRARLFNMSKLDIELECFFRRVD